LWAGAGFFLKKTYIKTKVSGNYTDKEGVDLCLDFEVTLIVLESCSRERLFSSLFSYREKNLKLYWQMIFLGREARLADNNRNGKK